eukprot:scaffold16768_cov117-Isochrysis_galbana.AAC.4
MLKHGVCGIALSERWLELVATAAIASSATLADGRAVRYGLRLAAKGVPEEFAVTTDGGRDVMPPLRRTVVGGYTIELRPNRALRPPPTLRLVDLPPHDEGSCSLCSGPLRLALRPAVARVLLRTGRTWDIHYNISPMDPDGHYLLVPDISDPACRRRQLLTRADCEARSRRGISLSPPFLRPAHAR